MARITLVLGGTRSGKSELAERLASESGRPVVYLAAAEPVDAEMRRRIARHRRRRPVSWQTVEAGADLPAAFERHAGEDKLILVDCLSLLVSALAEKATETAVLTAIESLVETAGAARAETIFVSSEVGMGVVPGSAVGRDYRDLLGEVNQAVAAAADRVYLAIAGLPLTLKGETC